MNRYHYNLGKSVFICSSAILGLWLGANTTTNNVQAETTTEEPTSQQISKATQTTTSNLNQADKEESKALPTAQTATPVTQTENQTNSTEDKPETKAIVHYQGDGDTWKPYIWGADPGSNGQEYEWTGEDSYGKYASITLDGNYKKLGLLIKDKNWGKDGSGNDRTVTVPDNGRAEVWYKAKSDDQQKVTPTYNHANIKLHYYEDKKSDNQVKNINYWTDTDNTKRTVSLDKNNEADFNFTDTKIGFHEIYVEPVEADKIPRTFKPMPGSETADVYVVNNDSKAYYSKSFAPIPKKQTQKPNQHVISNTTDVTIHFNGDGTKWVPYIWGKKPNSSGTQYKWDGKDDYGYYANITLDNNYQQIGALIKGVNDWGKDGSGQDRAITVDDNGKAEVWYKEKSDDQQKVTPVFNGGSVTVHYYNNNDVKQIKVWTDDNKDKAQTVTLDKNHTGNITLTDKKFKQVFVAPVGSDTAARSFTLLPGTKPTNIYLVNKDYTAYYTESFALAQQSVTSASMTSPNTVAIETGKKMSADEAKADLTLNDNNSIAKITAVDPDSNGRSKKFEITTTQDLDILDNNQIGLKGNYKAIDLGSYVRSKAFDDKYGYDGNDLGVTYDKKQTTIKLWSPTAKSVVLNIYDSLDNDAQPAKTIIMKRGDKGVWSSVLEGDMKGKAYDYSLTFGNGLKTQTDDPYSKAVTVNGDRTVIEDYDNIKPNNFNRMPEFSSPTQAIIYETSIRDFSSDPNSGIKDKGKYLGMIESGKTPTGQVTGLAYLKALGITHVQIMPSFDYASVDETKPLADQYNWGYDPKNYDVPEGSYSSDPKNPTARIKEMKEMINGLHKAGIRVVMDVVYNHVFDPKKQAFELTVPGYYFHYDKDNNPTGISGCGNDIRSTGKMVRKYIVDSVTYWAKQYKVDGFRFDIMSLLDTDTMNAVRAALDKIDPGIITYGEGWDMNPYCKEVGTSQPNAPKVPDVGFFSDDIRNTVKGDDDPVNGNAGLVIGNGHESNYANNAKKFVDSFLGGQKLKYDAWETHPYVKPSQMINYVSCHDGYTLYDYIKKRMPNESDANIAKRIRLADSMVMFAEGIPFFHSGQEGLRTKAGNNNSYNSSIRINQIDWDRIGANKDTVNYFKQLTDLRKKLSALHLNNYDQINQNVKAINAGKDGIFAFEYKENGKKMYIIFNVNNKDAALKGVDLTGYHKLLDSDGKVSLGQNTTLMPLSTLVVEGVNETPTTNIGNQDETQPVQIPSNVNTSTEVSADTIELTHNAYVYDSNGDVVKKTDGSNIDLIKGSSVKILDNGQTTTIKNKEFYRIGENQYVKVANILKDITKLLVHNAYVYDINGNIVTENGKKLVLKNDRFVKVRYSGRLITINGKKFYQIGHNKFIKAVNTGLKGILKHNSFVYNKEGRRVKANKDHILLRKQSTVFIMSEGHVVTIRGKKFYRIGKNKYIKVRNVDKLSE